MRTCGSPASRSSNAAVSRDLPMPASPERSTTWPSPAFACPSPQQQIGFFLAPDERGEPARVQRLEAAFLRALSQRREGAGRPGQALEVLWAEIGKFEQVAQQLPRALGNDDAVGRGDPLQPCGEVRRVADDAALLRLSRPQKIADDHNPRRDPDPHMQRRSRGRLQLRRGLDDREPGAHRALRVMLVRLRIAEIGEHAVAHVFGDEAAVAPRSSVAQHL